MPVGFLSEEASEAKKTNIFENPLITSLRPTFTNKIPKASFKEPDDLLVLQRKEIEFVDVSTIPEDDSDEDNDDNDDDDEVSEVDDYDE
ncbi:unnamed protein product [Euphydryas editha]|uniref:Uncharacterized protein n=1 Tax=Euphydryas editha TaxID=104508 RepID=A0AAU9U7A9_EUPED|nr:unnamed protein product [Euphydryas editha]